MTILYLLTALVAAGEPGAGVRIKAGPDLTKVEVVATLPAALAKQLPAGKLTQEQGEALLQFVLADTGDDEVAIPHVADIEVVSGIRGLLLGGRLTEDQAMLAVRGFRTLPLLRFDHGPLLARCWELRSNLTSYEGAYVALAELLEISLLTEDARLARAPGLTCAVEVLPS